MKTWKKSLMATAIAGGLTVSGSANAFITFWFDSDAAGATSAVRVGEYMDYIGGFYFENTYADATANSTFTLNQAGYGTILGKDGAVQAPWVADEVVSRFSGPGTGSLATDTVSFTGGIIEIFSGGYGGTKIASFDIVGGGADLDSGLGGAPVGSSSLIGRATFFEAGYWFFDNAGMVGADMSTFDLTNEILLGFAVSDLSFVQNQAAIDSLRGELIAAYPTTPVPPWGAAGAFPATNVFDEQGRVVSGYSGANGQFRLQPVPEPATLALAGLGLLGLAATRRRSIKSA